jgi:hypothetical protein
LRVQPETALNRLLSSIDSAVGKSGGRWFLFGAQAVNVWGVPRLTNDVDITVGTPGGTDELVAEFRSHGFRPRFDFDPEFTRRTRVIPMVHEETEIPIDIVLAGPGLEDEFFERARMMRIERVDIPVISPEDLMISKVVAGRGKDLEDIRGILTVRGDAVDLDRVRGTLAMLEEALGQSDLVASFEALIRETK